MRADRDDLRFAPERRNYTMPIIGGTALILALLLYIGLRDTDELIEEPAVVRDSAIVAPPVVDTTTPVQQPTADDTITDAPPRDFNERALPPLVDTVGVGIVTPETERTASERLVIDGALLEELEEDAQVRAGDASPNQLRTPQ